MLRALPLLLLAACASSTKSDEDDDESGEVDEVDPGPVESCEGLWTMSSSTPAIGETGVPVDTPIEATLTGGLTQSEIEHCDASFQVRLVVDTHEDPAIDQWTLVNADADFVYEGDREWTLTIEPRDTLAGGWEHAVEVDLHMDTQLPLGIVWNWTTAE